MEVWPTSMELRKDWSYIKVRTYQHFKSSEGAEVSLYFFILKKVLLKLGLMTVTYT